MENQDYLSTQLITYIGNKRALLDHIGDALSVAKKSLGKDKLVCFDGFSGSGVVARFLKQHSSKIIANDFEKYCHTINQCYLKNKSEVDEKELSDNITELNTSKFIPTGADLISRLYAPQDDTNIKLGERVFYTTANANIIDNIRFNIDKLNNKYLYLAPLLSEASIHTNTSGIFKGYHKNSQTGIGQFGGDKGSALKRILGQIQLPVPVFSNYECDVELHNDDTNILVKNLKDIDFTYYDPPYNQHPYGSNYFMLNVICDYVEPQVISKVSGIPNDWKKSDYNKKKTVFTALSNLIADTDSKYIAISYSNEGFISYNEMAGLCKNLGALQVLEKDYNTFRGSRNLNERALTVKEYIFLVKK